jgi:hypothetical protein
VALLARDRHTGNAVALDAPAITSLKLISVIERAGLWKLKLTRLGGQGSAHCHLGPVAHPARVLLAGRVTGAQGPGTQVFCSQLRQ